MESEIADFREEQKFVETLQKDISNLIVGDWISDVQDHPQLRYFMYLTFDKNVFFIHLSFFGYSDKLEKKLGHR